LTTARFAEASERASAAVGSYECGSWAGLVTMLRTDPLVPTSWTAMLPQKFSAATMWTPLVRGSEAVAAHPVVSVNAATSAGSTASLRGVRDTSLDTLPYRTKVGIESHYYLRPSRYAT